MRRKFLFLDLLWGYVFKPALGWHTLTSKMSSRASEILLRPLFAQHLPRNLDNRLHPSVSTHCLEHLSLGIPYFVVPLTLFNKRAGCFNWHLILLSELVDEIRMLTLPFLRPFLRRGGLSELVSFKALSLHGKCKSLTRAQLFKIRLARIGG